MTTKKLWDARADIRGNIESGLRDHAHVISRTHSQWDVTGVSFGISDRIWITLDNGADIALVNLQAPGDTRTILLLETLVTDINNAFAGGNPALQFRGGRLLVKSFREGVGSRVQISGDAAALALLDFNRLDVQGRSIEDAFVNAGVEDNPTGTYLIAEGEQDIRESNNRPSVWLATAADRIQGYINADRATPYTSVPPEYRTMDDLGAPRVLQLTNITQLPAVGETITGLTSGKTARVYNVSSDNSGPYLVIVSYDGDFTVGEALQGSITLVIADVAAQVKDTRIRAVKPMYDVFVGGAVYPMSSPTDMARLFNVTVYDRPGQDDGTMRNMDGTSGASMDSRPVFTTERPHRTGRRVRVGAICDGVPSDAYNPTPYAQTGVQRTGLLDVVSWTKNRIYPAAMPALTHISVGDVATISNSQSPIGSVPLNNGNYMIAAIGTDYIEIGPAKGAVLAGIPVQPEWLLPDPEIFDSASPTVPQAKVQVISPSYVLRDSKQDLSNVDRSCWLWLEEPVEAAIGDVTVSYYLLTSLVDQELGYPDFETPWSRYQRARIDDIERMLSSLDMGGISTGMLQLGRKPETGIYHDQIRAWAHYGGLVPDDDVMYDFFGAARYGLVNRQTDPQAHTAWPYTPELLAGTSYLTEAPVSPGVTKNTVDRKVSTRYMLMAYTAIVPPGGPPTFGTVLVGGTTGANLFVWAHTLTNILLVEVLTPNAPPAVESFTWGGSTLTGVSYYGLWGLTFDLPLRPLEAITASLGMGSASVTLSSAPTDGDIRPGDVFWVTSGNLYTNLRFHARIQQVLTPTSLVLESVSPLTDAAAEFRITPNICRTPWLQGATAYVRVNDPYIIIEWDSVNESGPSDHGVMIGDEIEVAGLTNGAVPIKSLRRVPGAGVTRTEIVEVESGYDQFTDGNGIWTIYSRHQRTTTDKTAISVFNDNHYGAQYHAAGGSEWWQIKGPGYVKVVTGQYDTLFNYGGLVGNAIGGWSPSGLTGKSLTFDLYVGGVRRATKTITFISDPATTQQLVTAINSLLLATTPWLSVYLAYPQTAIVFATTARNDTYGGTLSRPYEAIGPGVSLQISGSAWETMLAGGVQVEQGNLSQVVRANMYHEFLAHVDVRGASGPVYYDFPWSGTVDLIEPAAELGSDWLDSTVNRVRGGRNIARAEDPNWLGGGSDADVTQTGDEVAIVEKPTMKLASDQIWPYSSAETKALQVQLGLEERASLTHGGVLALRERQTQLLDTEHYERLDGEGRLGWMPEPLHSGPIGLKLDVPGAVSWDGHVLSLIVTTGNTYNIVDVLFTSAHTTLPLIVAHINAQLSAWTGWLRCEVDRMGTGFTIFADPALMTADVPPSFNNRFRVAINPLKTTLFELFNNDSRFSALLPCTWAGPYEALAKLISYSSAGWTAGATEGLVVDRAGGRRLIAPSHSDRDATILLPDRRDPLLNEVWWDERPVSIRGDMEVNQVKSGSYDLQESTIPSAQPESLVFLGGAAPGPGPVFLYQFPDIPVGGAAFNPGQEIVYLDGDENIGNAFLKRPELHLDTRGQYEGIVTELVRKQSERDLHAGGSFIADATPLTAATMIAYYNPVLLEVDGEVGGPLTLGDALYADVGLATGFFGGRFTEGGKVYIVIYGSRSRWRITSGADRQETWVGSVEDGGGFEATIVSVQFLDSNFMQSGSLKPVAALSYEGFNPNERFMRKPVITSYGDVQVMERGDYLFHEPLPTSIEWPVETGLGISAFKHKKYTGTGRVACRELTPSEGHYGVVDLSSDVGEITFPLDGNIPASSIYVWPRNYRPELLEYVSGGQFREVWSPNPPLAADPLWGGEEYPVRYSMISFHVPLPANFVALEGYGAYIQHDRLSGPILRAPAIVALYLHNNQLKDGDYIHRLEVGDTFGQMIRVDSAGGGERKSTMPYAPSSWAYQDLAFHMHWDTLPVTALHSFDDRTLELFVEDVSGGIPIITHGITASANPGPEYRQLIVAYCERYGTILTPSAYRILAYQGPPASYLDGDPRAGYPRCNMVSPPSSRSVPPDTQRCPWPVFVPGERVEWGLLGDVPIGNGRLVKVNQYHHGRNVCIRVFLPSFKNGALITSDTLGGVFVRFRCDRLDMNNI